MKNETNRSEKKSWNLLLVLALTLCVAFGLAALTYSWLTDSADAVAPTDEYDSVFEEASIGDFSYDLEYTFAGDNTGWTRANGLGGIVVDCSDSSAGNYIGNLKLRIGQSGSMKSAVRLKFSYQWVKAEETTAAAPGVDIAETSPDQVYGLQGEAVTLTPTLVGSVWHSADDGFYYYLDGSSYVFPRAQSVNIANGFSIGSASISSNMRMRVIVYVEGVQFNRYREVWEVSSIPDGNS